MKYDGRLYTQAEVDNMIRSLHSHRNASTSSLVAERLRKTMIKRRNARAVKQRKLWKQQIEAGIVILCAICGEPAPAKARGSNRIKFGGKGAISVDHIIPLMHGGTDEPGNLQPTHVYCNQQKGSKLL